MLESTIGLAPRALRLASRRSWQPVLAIFQLYHPTLK